LRRITAHVGEDSDRDIDFGIDNSNDPRIVSRRDENYEEESGNSPMTGRFRWS